jgi:hypothetical protein
VCRRVLVLEHGRLMFDGDVDEGLAYYGQLVSGAIPAVAAEAP